MDRSRCTVFIRELIGSHLWFSRTCRHQKGEWDQDMMCVLRRRALRAFLPVPPPIDIVIGLPHG